MLLLNQSRLLRWSQPRLVRSSLIDSFHTSPNEQQQKGENAPQLHLYSEPNRLGVKAPTHLQSVLSQLEHLQLETSLREGLLPQQLHFIHSCSYPGKYQKAL